MKAPTCTCPKRTENGQIVRCGRDVMCVVHGDPAPHVAGGEYRLGAARQRVHQNCATCTCQERQ